MEYGQLSSVFACCAAKTLTDTDINPECSNGHEINGVASLVGVLGCDDRKNMQTSYAYIDDEGVQASETSGLSWYDSRRSNPNRSAEWRLYYTNNDAIAHASVGDRLYITVKQGGSPSLLIAKGGSDVSSQLDWLFGVDDSARFEVRRELPNSIGVAESKILDLLGVELPEPAGIGNLLDEMIARYPDDMPSCAEFSSYSRGTISGLDDMTDDPDEMLCACYDREYALFKAYEKEKALPRFKAAMEGPDGLDVDAVLEVSMSIFQRRKARAGAGLENHAAYIFDHLGIRYTPQAQTERTSTMDFIFPGIEQYRDDKFPVHRLTALGAKTTCKERWKEVLDEADRIEEKHLLTLEPAISTKTTNNMREKHLQLVVPRNIQSSYKPSQQIELMSFAGFCAMVKEREHVC